MTASLTSRTADVNAVVATSVASNLCSYLDKNSRADSLYEVLCDPVLQFGNLTSESDNSLENHSGSRRENGTRLHTRSPVSILAAPSVIESFHDCMAMLKKVLLPNKAMAVMIRGPDTYLSKSVKFPIGSALDRSQPSNYMIVDYTHSSEGYIL